MSAEANLKEAIVVKLSILEINTVQNYGQHDLPF
jgi:hypothetical protein